jgi:hypothetical protein
MSGPFGAGALQFFSGGADFYSHSIDQSLRFEDGNANYLKITQGTPTLEKKYTISAWIKLGNISAASRMIIGGYDNSTGQFPFYLRSDHKLGFYDSDGVSTFYNLYGNSILRDPSAWYHVVLNFDSANGTAANRIRMYINGDEETVTGTLPSNRAGYANQSGTILQVGASNNNTSNPFEGYMAEVHFIDGSVLAPTEFAETKAGIWIPKDTSDLTFGNNGFRLKFQDSSAIGDDTSGNGNDLTTVTFAATDVVLDSPTNNFCTLNPLDGNSPSNSYIKEGNLLIGDYVSTDAARTVGGTMAMRSGKWYFEICRTLARADCRLGIIREDKYLGASSTGATGLSSGDYSYHVIYNGELIVNGSSTPSWQGTLSDDEVFQVAYDADTGKVWFGINNTWGGSGDPANGTNPAATVDSYSDYGYKPWIRVIGNAFGYEEVTLNCGQDSSFAGVITAGGNADGNGIGDFKYAPPSGFLALCSANLPNPGIDPAQDEEPADYFNTVLYTGNGSAGLGITGVGFQPDLVWIKARSDSYHHMLTDSVRGVGKRLSSSQTTAESSDSNAVDSFDSDGFTLDSGSSINNNSDTFVSWNWLAGGTASSNTNGSITSSVSANTEAGFSIVSYTGTGSNATVGHGLSIAPEMMIIKSRSDSSNNWMVYAKPQGATKYAHLNLSNAFSTASTVFQDTEPTSSVFSIGTANGVNQNTYNFICYAFHSVDGFSKVGSYTGNSSSEGTFVYTGFRPAFVFTKSITASSAWRINDAARDPFNGVDANLYPSAANAEDTGTVRMDFLSNGFKLRVSGGSHPNASTSYIYMAFAEQPFKYSNAR